MVMVFGEITTKAKVDYEAIVRKTCEEIGFTSEDVGLDCKTCKVLVHIEEQSPDIGQGVHGMGGRDLKQARVYGVAVRPSSPPARACVGCCLYARPCATGAW